MRTCVRSPVERSKTLCGKEWKPGAHFLDLNGWFVSTWPGSREHLCPECAQRVYEALVASVALSSERDDIGPEDCPYTQYWVG